MNKGEKLGFVIRRNRDASEERAAQKQRTLQLEKQLEEELRQMTIEAGEELVKDQAIAAIDQRLARGRRVEELMFSDERAQAEEIAKGIKKLFK